MGVYAGNITATITPEQEKEFLDFIKEKYSMFDTDKYENAGKVYFSVDEDLIVQFVNDIEETFRDIWFNIFCIDEINELALTISYRNRIEKVCQYDRIETDDGKLHKLNETVEEIDDECIRRRKEETNA